MEELTYESSGHKPLKLMVPVVGIEPTRGCPHRILSPYSRIFNPFCNYPLFLAEWLWLWV